MGTIDKNIDESRKELNTMTDGMRSILCEQLIDLLKFIADFLNEHNLKWSLGYGSAIGAVRHHGIIPWDDDIDIIMPRNDYNKLLELQNEICGRGYTLASMDTIPNYHFPFVKIMNNTSSIWEMKEHPFILGTYIDIFPLDSCSNIDEAESNRKKLFKYLHKIQSGLCSYNFMDIVSSVMNRQFGRLYIILLSKINYFSLRYNTKKFGSREKSIESIEGEYYVNYWSIYGVNKDCFHKKLFENTIQVSFEGQIVNLLSGYDCYLRQLYGDYMKLPPVNKRITHHHRYYENFKESLPIDIVKTRMQKGEKLVF